jgi:hypothetical protein
LTLPRLLRGCRKRDLRRPARIRQRVHNCATMAAPPPPPEAARDDGPVMTGRSFHTITLHKETFSLDTRYTGLRYIGGGAYGSVLAGEDAATGRKVAIKKCRDTFRDLLGACARGRGGGRARARGRGGVEQGVE